ILRARRLANVRALIGSSDPPRPRPPPPWGGSSCAIAAREIHKKSGNSLMVAEYNARQIRAAPAVGALADGLLAIKTMGSVHVGTSGWHYAHWRGPFYPEKLPASKMLEFYTRHFDTVELNNTFYRLPTEKGLETWRESTPKGFCFAAKGS